MSDFPAFYEHNRERPTRGRGLNTGRLRHEVQPTPLTRVWMWECLKLGNGHTTCQPRGYSCKAKSLSEKLFQSSDGSARANNWRGKKHSFFVSFSTRTIAPYHLERRALLTERLEQATFQVSTMFSLFKPFISENVLEADVLVVYVRWASNHACLLLRKNSYWGCS